MQDFIGCIRDSYRWLRPLGYSMQLNHWILLNLLNLGYLKRFAAALFKLDHFFHYLHSPLKHQILIHLIPDKANTLHCYHHLGFILGVIGCFGADAVLLHHQRSSLIELHSINSSDLMKSSNASILNCSNPYCFGSDFHRISVLPLSFESQGFGILHQADCDAFDSDHLTFHQNLKPEYFEASCHLASIDYCSKHATSSDQDSYPISFGSDFGHNYSELGPLC